MNPVVVVRVLVFLLLVSGTFKAFGQRPLGVDVSHYQGSINWTSVKNTGVSFGWAKASEGLTVDDDYLTNNQVNAKAAGVLIGTYHFAHPESHPGLAGADQEAAHFWKVAQTFIKGTNTYLMPVLDMESSLTGTTPAYTKASLSVWVNEWCNFVVRAAGSNNVAVRPIIYTGISYSATWLNTTVTNWPLWMANWPSNPDPQTGAPSSNGPWPTWNFWQYTDSNSVPGSPTHGWDLDVFNGTAVTLSNFTIAPLRPYFIVEPSNQRLVDVGASTTFSALANGSRPFYYQWRWNGAAISGATNATLTLTNVQATNTGSYTLVVSNFLGSITSSVVPLSVYPLQATVWVDNFDVNTATNWTLNKSSSDTAATFSFDYSTLGIPAAPNATNGSTRGLQMKANLANGTVAALSLSPTNKTFSDDYRVHFDAWINVNGPFPNGGGGSTELLTGGIGTSGTRTQWTNGTPDGYYFAVDGDGGYTPANSGINDYTIFAGASPRSASSGAYFAGNDSTARGIDNAYYQRGFPVGRAAPALQQTNYPQQVYSLDPGTFGLAWHDVIVSKRGTTVDWVIDGIRIAAISNATFTASNVFVGFWDPFNSLSSNNAINFGLVDNVRVEQPAIAPLFTTNPVAATVTLGTNVVFTAAAGGLPAPKYQWLFNNTNILGATNAIYALAFVDITNAGNYSVIASNSAGMAASSNALLTILPPNPPGAQSASLNGGIMQISFTGDAYWTYTVEISTNLVDWNTLTNLTSNNGVFNFGAGPATNVMPQFFRVRIGP